MNNHDNVNVFFSKRWPKVVKITPNLGSNYAEHNLGVGHVQPHEYHYIPTYVWIN